MRLVRKRFLLQPRYDCRTIFSVQISDFLGMAGSVLNVHSPFCCPDSDFSVLDVSVGHSVTHTDCIHSFFFLDSNINIGLRAVLYNDERILVTTGCPSIKTMCKPAPTMSMSNLSQYKTI